ncbi:hypothetical protein [Geobacter pickeringii]|uniref:hypothetical protein n=1 Tax=Geobacter pickeringii TaxID=345632 RepID=UPI000689C63A|nr:hypothetical protein [Geobacter pickeringii]
MLRISLLICGLGLTAIGMYLWIRDKCAFQPFLIWGGILVVAVLFERWRYRRNEHNHDRPWQSTGEKFEDPETGQTVEVHYDPVTGERRYMKK